VLLTADAQSMLLDFHLAREPLQPGGPGDTWLGGTPEYMSPEQQRAFTAIRSGQPVGEVVDGRADVFGLGALLYQALGGALPIPKDPARTVREKCPRGSAGLAAVIGRCLAPDPAQRYARASSIAEDLRRHLNDLPLRGVSNRSFRERYRKWRRRHPHALVWGAILTAVLFGAVAAGVSKFEQIRDRRHQANLALEEGRQLCRNHAYPQALQVLSHGLELSRDLPGDGDLRNALTIQLDRAQRAQWRSELRSLAENLRFLTEGIDDLSAGDLGNLAPHCTDLWAARERLISDSSVASSSDEDATQVREDLLELVLFWLDARERLGKGEGLKAIHQDALCVLTDADAICGTSRALERQRERHSAALGKHEDAQAARQKAERLTPQTSWEHYLEGRALWHARDFESAQAAFAEATSLQPHDFWPHFYEGLCEYRLKHAEAAAAEFTVCIALMPDRAECFYNRGLALAASVQNERASRDFDRALDLAPNFGAASLERAVLHYQAKRYSRALDDLKHALAHGADRATVLYNEALVYQARQDSRSARSCLEQALQANPGHAPAQALLAKLQDGS
jgi:tetratricopeptide (TPR) repeat protein